MVGSPIPISPAGRIVCMFALDLKIRELAGKVQYYHATASEPYFDHEWVQQQELLIKTLTDDLNHLRDD